MNRHPQVALIFHWKASYEKFFKIFCWKWIFWYIKSKLTCMHLSGFIDLFNEIWPHMKNLDICIIRLPSKGHDSPPEFGIFSGRPLKNFNWTPWDIPFLAFVTFSIRFYKNIISCSFWTIFRRDKGAEIAEYFRRNTCMQRILGNICQLRVFHKKSAQETWVSSKTLLSY